MHQAHTGHQQSTPVTPEEQTATPPATVTSAATPDAPGEEITVVASNLANPRGFTWGPDGGLYVALAGDGGSPLAGDQSETSPLPDAPPSVVRIQDGEAIPVVHGLPSTQDAYGDVQGPVDVGFLGDQLYVLQDATGGIEAVGLDFPNGLYAAESEGSVRLVSSVTVYVEVNPAENLYHVLDLGEPFAMVVDKDETGFLVVDANQGLLLRILPEGTLTVIADLSINHPVPTAITSTPDGGVYVGFLGAGPHLDGTSKVVKVSADGDVSDYWTGLTMVTGLMVAPDGTLYALEMSTGNTAEPPNIYPNTGRVVRQTGPASLEEVVTGLNYPISMKMGPDGALYVTLPAIATNGEMGSLVRINPVAGETIVMPPELANQLARGRDGKESV